MLVFELPRKETVAPLRLYYGNPYIKMPDYDIQNIYDKNAKQIPLTIGIHTVSGKFSYSMIEPPVSTWIITHSLHCRIFITYLAQLQNNEKIYGRYGNEETFAKLILYTPAASPGA